ncbi:MAG: tetratricopeptide repeat protein, partial [Methylococcales bacterium]
VHEYLTCEEAKTEEFLPGPRIIYRHDGARARDPDAYRKDAALLEQALRDEPDNTRYTFYLAQSYRDAGELELAIKSYRRRAAMKGWDEEIWQSYYQIAEVQQRLTLPWAEVMESYLTAFQFKPDRAEPLYHLGMHYQHKAQYHISHLYFSRAMKIPEPPSSRLFVESNIYQHLLPLEYAVACYWLGDHRKAIEVNNRLLQEGKLPAQLVELVVKNRQFSLDALS